MPSRDEPARGNITPFPAAAIRRPPSPAFATQPGRASRFPARGRAALGWFALGSLLTAPLTVLLLTRPASTAAHRGAGAGSARGMALRSTVPGSVNLLIAGLDADDGARGEPAARADAILLLHLDADRGQAWLVSIPRDVRVTVPGHGERRIETAYALGGPALLVATLERLTRLPVDHVAVFDRTGLRRLTDGIGGVTLDLDPPAGHDAPPGELGLELDGAMAVDYVSEPAAPAAGDLEHIRREHCYLRALFARLDERRTFADPPALRDLAASLGASVRVDAALAPAVLQSLFESTRQLHARDVTLLTVPVVPAGRAAPPGSVRPDDAVWAELWDALAHDEMPAFVAAHPERVTPEASRSAPSE
jgi:LCP family protein required for cell wall assembly